MKMYNQIKSKDRKKIVSTLISFGNELFRVSLSTKGFWIIWRKEVNPLPFTSGMWLLNITFNSLKEAKKFIRDRKYYTTELTTYDELLKGNSELVTYHK